MDAAAMAYAIAVVAGVKMGSLEPIPMEQCTALKEQNPTTLCIEQEPACGKGEDVRCLGRADLNEAPAAKPRPKKKHSAYRYRRKTSHQGVGQILAKAL